MTGPPASTQQHGHHWDHTATTTGTEEQEAAQAHHTQTACLHPLLPCWGTKSFLLPQRANPWLLLVASLKRYKTLLEQLKAGGEGQRERNEDSQLGRAATQSTTNTSVLLQDDSIDTSQAVYSEKLNKSWVTLPEPATSRLTITANLFSCLEYLLVHISQSCHSCCSLYFSCKRPLP